ncbi:MAG: hypothetical protein IJT31_00370 [Oscillibacter sp.]|nr:hypothetical protein [Oscillibacter sp.]
MLPSNIIVIEGEAAREFMEAARNPDPEYLRQRDALFAQWDAMFSPIQDGGDIVLEIPDIDFDNEPKNVSLVFAYRPAVKEAYESIRVGGEEVYGYLTELNFSIPTIPIAA